MRGSHWEPLIPLINHIFHIFHLSYCILHTSSLHQNHTSRNGISHPIPSIPFIFLIPLIPFTSLIAYLIHTGMRSMRASHTFHLSSCLYHTSQCRILSKVPQIWLHKLLRIHSDHYARSNCHCFSKITIVCTRETYVEQFHFNWNSSTHSTSCAMHCAFPSFLIVGR